MVIKSRVQGTSIVLTIPAEFGIEKDTKFESKILPSGVIQFIPIQEEFADIWNDDPDDIKAFNKEIGSFDDGVSFGRENVEY